MSRVVNEPEAARKLSVSVPNVLWAQAERLYATDAKNPSASQVVQAALRVAIERPSMAAKLNEAADRSDAQPFPKAPEHLRGRLASLVPTHGGELIEALRGFRAAGYAAGVKMVLSLPPADVEALAHFLPHDWLGFECELMHFDVEMIGDSLMWDRMDSGVVGRCPASAIRALMKFAKGDGALSVLETDEDDLSRARFSPAWLAGVDDGVDDVLVEIEAAVEARSGAETAPRLRDGQGDGQDAT